MGEETPVRGADNVFRPRPEYVPEVWTKDAIDEFFSDEELEIRQRLKDNLEHYASRCLKIRSKAGTIQPFELNRAQTYLHSRIEAQLKRIGRVRVLILKGRQQGCCYSPEMRVLTADYRWIPIGNVEVGQRLVAVDDGSALDAKTAIGRRYSRKMRVATVEAVAHLTKKTYEISLDNGAKVIATAEHRHLCRQRGGCVTQWREVGKTKAGDFIRYITPPPRATDSAHEDGWFGGLLDGEGTYRNNPALRIAFSQVDGPVLRRAKRYLNERGIRYYESIDRRLAVGQRRKLGNKPVHCVAINRMADIIEVLSKCRPTRFVDRELFAGHELPGKAIKGGGMAWARVVSITALDEQPVIDLQTSEKTFICEGLVSHNSTYVGGRFYHKATHSKGQRVFILTHEQDATDNLFDMANRFHEHCPDLVKPQTGASNAKELDFAKLDSGYKVGTAGTKAVGRSQTIQLFHGSEVAFWPNAETHAAGILQAVPDLPGTEVILESTANGVGNFYHQRWQEAEGGLSEYEAIFIPWYWQDEYRKSVPPDFVATDGELEYAEAYGLDPEQICWRRAKIVELGDELLFKQEYPATAAEAFQLTGHDSYIPAELVLRARKARIEGIGPLVMGADPAWFGDDRFSVAWRRGRAVFRIESRLKLDTVAGANWIKSLIDSEKPARFFIDVGGNGRGTIDILFSWGEPYTKIVKAINFGSSPQEQPVSKEAKKKGGPLNRRAEMWKRSKEWLEAVGGADLPDLDSIQADACAPSFSYNMNSQLVLESKEHMRSRGVRSPDEWDAIALTFAEPVAEPKTVIAPVKPLHMSRPVAGAWMR